MNETHHPLTPFSGYIGLALGHAFRDFNFARDMLVGTCIALLTLGLQVWWKLIPLAEWREHRWQWIASFAAPFVVVLAADSAWRIVTAPWKLHQAQRLELTRIRAELQREMAKNSSPEFAGKIDRAYIADVQYFVNSNRIVKPTDSIVMLSVTAWNKREMSPSSVKEYALAMEVNGHKFTGTRNSGIPQLTRLTLSKADANYVLEINSSLPPLSYLKSDGGYLSFYVSGLQALPRMKATLELTLIDLTDKPHPIVLRDCELDYGKLECY